MAPKTAALSMRFTGRTQTETVSISYTKFTWTESEANTRFWVC